MLKKNIVLLIVVCAAGAVLAGCVPGFSRLNTEETLDKPTTTPQPEESFIPVRPVEDTSAATPGESVDNAIDSLDATLKEIGSDAYSDLPSDISF